MICLLRELGLFGVHGPCGSSFTTADPLREHPTWRTRRRRSAKAVAGSCSPPHTYHRRSMPVSRGSP